MKLTLYGNQWSSLFTVFSGQVFLRSPVVKAFYSHTLCGNVLCVIFIRCMQNLIVTQNQNNAHLWHVCVISETIGQCTQQHSRIISRKIHLQSPSIFSFHLFLTLRFHQDKYPVLFPSFLTVTESVTIQCYCTRFAKISCIWFLSWRTDLNKCIDTHGNKTD